MTITEPQYVHALNTLPSMQIEILHQCWKRYGTAERIWNSSIAELRALGVSPKTAQSIHAQIQHTSLTETICTLKQQREEHALQIIFHDDPAYPELLRAIPQPPLLLYCIGDLSVLQESVMISIVGSRKASAYGKQVVQDIVAGVVPGGACIVSGLAKGIDAAAHQATVHLQGRTIAVMGSSVLPHELYPRMNQALGEQIIATGGVIISEYPPGSRSYPSHFPERNRIIAGLSQATIVIEASQRSGSLITARHALECGREVFAVPGSIYAELSEGTNYLLSQGAAPWISCASLRNGLEYVITDATIALTSDEQIIVDQISYQATHIDDIIDSTHRPAHELLPLLTILVMKGAIKEIAPQQYIKNRNTQFTCAS